MAKILAKAVNCEHPVDGSPCGECASCRAIASGSSMNVIEIDAASNNGVENIRQIREEVSYPPTEGRCKVYIIDEVHMLSIGAFNALLKTLEEPPSYVMFILATTDVHKIPVTILSRCQRYDFRRISIDTIADYLKDLLAKEQVEAEDRAIRYIARAADGSMRDALSLTDQCIAFHLGERLTLDRVLEVLGAADTEIFGRLLQAVIDQNVTEAIGISEDMIMQGIEPAQLVNDFAWYLRNLLLIKTAEHMEDVLDMSTENLALLKEEAAQVDEDTILNYIRVFSELSGQMRYEPQKRILLEIALIRLCRPAMETTPDALTGRVAALEKQMEKGMVPSAPEPSAGSREVKPAKPAAPKPEVPKAIPEEVRKVVESWDAVTGDVPALLGIYLKGAIPSLGDDGRLILVCEEENAYEYLSRESNTQEIRDHILEKTGRQIDLQIRKNGTERPAGETYPDLRSLVQMEIDLDDD